MKHSVIVEIPHSSNILLELDDAYSPKTVNDFIEKLSFTVDLSVWGDEIYTSKSPIFQPEENAKSPVELNDVAYWPTGKAICLFYGSTLIAILEKLLLHHLSLLLEKLFLQTKKF